MSAIPQGDTRLNANIRKELHLKLKVAAHERRLTAGEVIEELVENMAASSGQECHTFRQYQKLAMRTLNDRSAEINLLHAVLGAVDEVGELAKAIKNHLIYGKPLDVINLLEESGDALWFMALLAQTCGTTLEDIAQRNINKLRARFPDGFEIVRAIERDLKVERDNLELALPVA